jgi:hypothetical protein
MMQETARSLDAHSRKLGRGRFFPKASGDSHQSLSSMHKTGKKIPKSCLLSPITSDTCPKSAEHLLQDPEPSWIISLEVSS